jgi:hypothetical protein
MFLVQGYLGTECYYYTNMIGEKTNRVGNEHSSLAALFATQTTVSLLSIFALYPQQVFFQRDLVEMTAGNLYLVQRELKRLERSGLIMRRRWGRQVEYRVDVASSAARSLLAALLHSFALRDPLAATIAQVDAVHLAFVYGPVLQGQARTGVPIKLGIVCDHKCASQVADALAPLSQRLGSRVEPVPLARETQLDARDATAASAMARALGSQKLWIVGDDASFGRWLGSSGGV